jgi:DNA-directed RNA polymerase subunit A"
MSKITPELLEKKLVELYEDGIPEDLIERIRNKLQGEELAEEQLDYFLNKIFINFNNAIVETSEPVGTVAAQSIGEPGTQMSIPGTEQVIIKKDGIVDIVSIGDFIDEMIDLNEILELNPISADSIVYNLSIDDKVEVLALDFDEKLHWKKLKQVSRHLPKQELVKIQTRSGREILSTQSHSFVIRHENKIQPIKGKDLTLGERLPSVFNLKISQPMIRLHLEPYLPKSEVWYGSELEKAFVSKKELGSDWKEDFNLTYTVPVKEDALRIALKRNKTQSLLSGYIYPKMYSNEDIRIPEFLELNHLTGWFIGAYLAEGSCTNYFVTITNSDQKYQQKVIEFAESFNINYKIVESKGQFGPSTSIHLFSSLLSKLIQNICGKGSSKKKVPPWTLYAPDDFVAGLLKAYFDGDGSFSFERQQIRASSNSKQLIDGICLLLSRFGIFATKKEMKQYNLIISGKYSINFYKSIGSDVENKASTLEKMAILEENNINQGIVTYDHIDMITGFGEIFKQIARKLKINSKSSMGATIRKLTKNQRVGRQTLGRYLKTFEGLAIKQKADINDLLAILKNAYNSDVIWDEIVKIEFIKSPTRYVYDFAVDGLETFTTFEGFITHNTLRTFHYAGVEEFSVTQGLPRLIEIVDARRFPSTPQMTIFLEDPYNESEAQAIKVHNRIEQIRIEQITHDVDLDFVNWNIVINLIPEICESKGIDIERIPEILKRYKKKGSIKREGNAIIIDPGIEDLQSLQKLREKILKKVVKGIRGVKRGLLTPTDDGKEWVVKTEGTNLQGVVQIEGVDTTRTVSNHIHEIEKLYGIEAARSMIIKESQKVLEQQGLDVDLRHLLILSDLMCVSGTIQSIGRHGISGSKSSVFARAAFEVTVNQLLDAGLYGEEERLLGIPENVIIGQVIPLGSGRVQIMFDLDANLEILEERKKKQ